MPLTGTTGTPTPEMLLEHAAFARGLARSLVLDDATADDVVQEAWASALERPPRHAANLRSWLGTRVRHVALHARRGESRRMRRERAAARDEAVPGPDEVVARLEIERRLVDAVAELSEPERSTVVLRWFEELPVGEIARRTATPVETVRTRCRRALARIRARLDRDHGGDRRAWQLALLPLARTAVPVGGAFPLIGGVLMSTKTLVLTGAAAAAVVGILLYFSGRDDGRGAARATQARGTPDAAARAEASSAADGDDAPAGEPAGTTEASPAPGVHGVVVDRSGAPVAGARVAFVGGTRGWHDGLATVATGEDGAFALGPRPEDAYRVGAAAEGHALTLVPVVPPPPGPLRLVLEPGCRVDVTVLDSGGRPVEGAPVRVSTRDEQGVSGMWSSVVTNPWCSAVTDAEGRAALGTLGRRRFELEVDDGRFARHVEVFDVHEPHAQALAVRLHAGGTIAGRVWTPGREPVAGAGVRADGRETTTDASGRYVLEHVGSAPTEVTAWADGWAAGRFGPEAGWDDAIEVTVDPGRRLDGIDIVLREAFFVVGRVADEQGEPVADATVYAWARTQNVGKTDATGRFRCGPFAWFGPHTVRVQGVAPGHGIEGGEFAVERRVGEFDVGTLAATAHVPLTGRVVDGKGVPASGATVRVLPDGRPRPVAADGSFRLEHLAPRAYVLQAERGDERGPLVRAEAGGAPVELELGPTAAIAGRVTDTAGDPLPDVAVRVVPADGPVGSGERYGARTAADGTYAIDGLPRGPYLVGPSRAANVTERDRTAAFRGESRTVEAGATGVDFVLPAARAVLTGRVVSGRTGRPLRHYAIRYLRYGWLVPEHFVLDTVEDDAGRFRRGVDEPGRWAVEVEAPGHAKLRTGVRAVEEGGTLDFGELRLGVGATVRGVVRDARGEPVPFTRIHLLNPAVDTNFDAPYTDAGGRFELTGVAPGTWNLFAVSPRHPLGIARGLTLTEGEQRTVDFTLEDPAPVTVVVLDADGEPVAGAEVVYAFEAIAPLNSKFIRGYVPDAWGPEATGPDGRCVQRAWPAAPVRVTIEAEGFLPATRVVDLSDRDVDTVEFRLRRSG